VTCLTSADIGFASNEEQVFSPSGCRLGLHTAAREIIIGEASRSAYLVSVPINLLGRQPLWLILRDVSATQVDHVLQILPALLRPAVIARLVLGAHQRIGPTATISGEV